jgi:hypothetical protein
MARCLRQLPDAFGVTSIGPADVVVGPTGVFVVLAHDGSIERARGLVRLASTVRSALAEEMAWVPFVHALLVDDAMQSIAQATVVPPQHLTEVLTEGRMTLELETIETILALVRDGVLDGLQAVGPADRREGARGDGARLAECSASPAATTSPLPSTNSAPTPGALPFSSPTQPASTVGSGSHSPIS